jgi:autotransporter-associated beta strand protein
VTNDAVFSGSVGGGIRTLNANNLTVGSFNVTAPSGTYSIRNEASGSTNSTLTLGGAGRLGNGISGTSTDLLYAASGSTFNIRGDNANGSGTLILALGQNGTFNIAGTSEISSAITGTGFGFTKTGVGTLTLSGNNTHTGGTTLNAGVISVNNAGALGNTGTISFGGGRLQYTANNTTDYSSRFSTGASQLYSVDTNGQSVTWASNLSSSGGSLTKNGTGTLTVSGANTYTGTTTVNAGTLAFGADQNLRQIAGAGNLSLSTYNLTSNASSDTTFSGVISGSGNLTKTGTGTLTLSGANTYTGSTTIQAGNVVVSNAAAFGSNSSGTTVADGAGVRLSSALTLSENFAISGNGSNGNGALYATQAVTISGNITLASNATISSDVNGALQLTRQVTSGASSGTTILTLTGNSTYGNNKLSGYITDNGNGKLGIVKNGTGNWDMSGTTANNFSGGVQINSGTLSTGGTSTTPFGAASNIITLGSAAGGDATFTHGGSYNITNVFIVKEGNGNRTVMGNKNNGLNLQLILEKDLNIINNNGQGVALNSEIIGKGNLSLTSTQNNTVAINFGIPSIPNTLGNYTFTSRNLFTGSIIIGNNTLAQFGDNVDYSGSALDIRNGGVFNVNKPSVVGGLNGEANGSVISQQSGGGTLTLGGSGNYSFAGSIRNGTTATNLVIRLNKEGVQGSQTLAGNNSYTGSTTLQGGTLVLDYSAVDGSKLSNSGALTLNGSTLVVAGGNHTEIIGNTTLSTGFNTISRSAGNSTLALGALTLTGGGINFSASNIATTTTNSTVNGLLGAKAFVTVGGQDWARNDGSNNIVAFSAGNYTAISNSTNLTTANFNHYLANSNVTLAHGQDLYLGTLKIDPTSAGQSFKITGGGSQMNFRFGNGSVNGGILFTGNQDYSLLGDGNGNIYTETSIFNYSTGNLTLGKFSNSLKFYGNGTTILSQDSLSNSVMYLYGGTVRFASNLQLGNATTGGSLQLFGGTFQANTAGGNISLTRNNTTQQRDIVLGYNTPRIDVIGGNTLRIGGVISSTSSGFTPIVFGSSTANGTIVLAGTNTFSGDIRLEGATLSVGADAQLGNVGNMLVFGGNATFKTTGSFTANRAVAINTGYTGTFAPDTGTTFTLNQPIRGAGDLMMNGAGTLVLSGTNIYTGATKISQGTLFLTSLNAVAKSSSIQLSGGGGLTYNGSSGTLGQNIIVTSGSGILRNSGGGLLTLNGSISKNGTTLRLSQGSFAVNGAITGSAANSDIYLESGSAITFTGTNTYNGPTYILNGTTLNANSAGALPGTTDLVMDNTGSGSSVLNLGANQSIGSISGNTSSAINLSSYSLTTNSASSTTFAGAISGSGGLTKAGAGTLTLSGANTYNGSTAITAGTLSLGSGGAAGGLGSGNISISSGAALVANRSDDLTLANAISGAGDILQSGSGNTTLSGVNTNTGAVRATAGQLNLSGANALSSSISALEVNNATLSLADGTARTTSLTTASLSANSATFVFDISTSAADMLLLGGSATLAGSNTVNLNFLNAITTGQSWVLLNATGGGLEGTWTLGTTSGSGQSGFTFSLSATSNALTLTAATSSSTYYWKGDQDNLWGTTNGSDSNWASDSSGSPLRSSPPSSGSDVVFAATGAGNLATTLDADRTIKSLTISQESVQINGANTLTMQSTAASGILVNAASGTVTIGANLAGTSTGLTKEGASLLVLSGNNSYGGGTTLTGGTLRVGSDASLGNSTAGVTLSGNAVLQAASDLTLSSSRPLVMSGNGSLDSQSYTVTLNGTLGGSGTLQKTGAGSLILNNANSITGVVSPAAGTLVLANQNALSSATLAMAGGAVSFSSSVGGNAFTLGGLSAASTGAGYDIQLQNTAGQAIALTAGSNNASTIYAAALSGNGSLTKAGTGALTLSGNNTYTGATTVNAGTLAVTGSLSATPAITINGGTLSLDSTNAVAAATTITLANASGTAFNVTANQTISSLRGGGTGNGTTAISSFRTLTVQESSTQSYNGTITGDGRFQFNGSGNLTLGGVLSHSGGVTIASGALTLYATNTYTGGTTLQGGVLNINNSAALGADTLTIAGGTLGNTSGADVTLGAIPQVWNGDFAFSSANRTLNLGTGGVTLAANRTVTVQSGTLTVSGTISGVGLGITKAGNGTLLLQGSNAFTGGVTINEGTLLVNGGTAINDAVAVTIADTAGATLSINSTESIASLRGGGTNSGGVFIASGAGVTVAETGNQTFAGPLSGNGTFAKTLTGRINLTNNASTLSGQVQVHSGILAVSSIGMSGAPSPLGSNGTIIVGASGPNAGTLRWEGIGNETTNKNIYNDTANTGSNFAPGAELFAANAGATLTIAGNVTSNRAPLKTFTLNGSGGSIIVSGTISNGANATHTMQALITGTGNATHGFTGSNNSFTGGVTIQSNTANNSVGLRVTTIGNSGSNSSLGTNGTINIGGNATGSTSTLVYAGTGETTDKVLNLQGTLGNVALEQAGTGNLKFTSNMTVTGAGAKQLILQGSTAGTGEFAGLIVDSASGATSLVKNGTGTWILSGANTYTGNTTLNAGTLQLSGNGALGSGSITLAGGTLDLGGKSLTNTISGLTGGGFVNGTITNDGGNYAFQDGTISAVLAGTSGLAKTGVGTLALTANNSFTGSTTISAGNLSISQVGALASTSGVTLDNATALLYTGSAATLDRSISVTSGTGTIRNNGSGLLTLSGALAKDGTTLTLQGGSNGITVSGAISGASANSDLVIDGGTVTLASANSYNGPTYIINSGTLNANTAGALPTGTLSAVTINGSSTLSLGDNQSVASLSGTSGSSVNLNAKTLTINGSSDTTYSGGVSGTGNLVKNGSGNQTLAGATTYTGSTTINSGTLIAAAANAAGSTSNVVINNGGSFLVTADDAIGTNTAIELDGGTLAFGAAGYSCHVGALTLSADSILDLGTSGNGVLIRFNSINWSDQDALLSIYNWTGTTQWQGGNGNNTDQVYFENTTLTSEQLQQISFYSGFGTGFAGTAFQLSSLDYNRQIIAVPEPSTLATGLIMVIGSLVWIIRGWRKSKQQGKSTPSI